jgi:PAS domain S-box-containing protein
MLIRIATFAVVMTYVNASNRRIAWVFIAAAMLLMALENAFQLLFIAGLSDLAVSSYIPPLAGFVVSVLILTGTLLIRSILKRLRKAERINRVLDNRYRILFNSSSDQIFVLNMAGKIVEVNQSACENLGYGREDLLSKHFSEIKADPLAAGAMEHLNKIRQTGSYIFESEHLNSHGGKFPVEINCRRIVIEEEPYIICVSRNIADRKEVEKKIMTAIIETEETERSRFATEIHDGLGPLLSTIKLYVNELDTEQISQHEREEQIAYINQLIDEAVDNARNIANNITPKIITDYGLIRSIQSFCDAINATNILRIDFQHHPDKLQPSTTLSLTLYRIITELINNTIKHANADRVRIELQQKHNRLYLDYFDNGIGFDLEKAMQKNDTRMGVKNIISRVQSVKGVFNFQNTQPGIHVNIQIDVGKGV